MSMIDWCGVAYAAKEEPVSKIVTKLIEEEQTKGHSKLISNGQEVSAKSAAFVNGTIGHALIMMTPIFYLLVIQLLVLFLLL